MTPYNRVAIFYAPASKSPLAEFGSNWLGWDIEKAIEAKHPEIPKLPTPISDIIATPQKYGFHGTLKAPFRLNTEKSLDELRNALRRFSEPISKFTIGQMKVARLGNFVAIIQETASGQLQNFASTIVEHFEEFRAPLSDDDITKRRKTNLSPRQDELMLKWGYPFIFDEFKFHLTLTGKLNEHDAEITKNILAEYLSDILAEPLEVIDICLYGERGDGRFEIIGRFPLQG
jgi:putative phosphonate metabolism protein